jgi:hypothetical protein
MSAGATPDEGDAVFIVRIDHAVPSYDAWKAAFDSDPLGREESGVRSHRVARAVDDPNRVWIDLHFEDRDAAASMVTRLETMWSRVQAEGLIGAPTAHVLEQVEQEQYGG